MRATKKKSLGRQERAREQLRERTAAMNEQLVLAGIHQHELATATNFANTQLRSEMAERKQTEESLRKSEERFRALFELGPVAVYSCDASGVIQEFNGRAAELWGREPAGGDTDERFCGSFKLFRPDGSFMPHHDCPMADVVSGKISAVQDAEVLIERPDGSRVTVVVNIRPLKNERGEITGAINCFYNITERKRAEEALRQSQAQLSTELVAATRLQQTSTFLIQGGNTNALYKQIIEAAVALMQSDMASLQMYYPDRGNLRLLAWKGFKVESAAFWEWVRPSSRSSCSVALKTARRVIVPDVEQAECMVGTEDLIHCRKSGIRAVQSTPLLSRHGNVVGIISTHWRKAYEPSEPELRLFDVLARQAADLIERMQTEQARAKLASIVEFSDDAIISKDLNGIITSWNKGAAQLFGYTAQEAMGHSITMLIPANHLNEEPEILRRIRRGESIEHYETVRRRKDGTLLNISLTVSPIRNEDGEIVGASKIARDVTDRKRAEESLRQAQAQLADRAVHLEGLVAERTAKLTAAHNQLLAEANKRKRLEGRIVHAVEAEQLRLGGELHDGLAQQVTAAAMMLCTLEIKMKQESPMHTPKLHEVQQILLNTAGQARNLASGFYPIELQKHGLKIALQGLARTTAESFGISCSVETGKHLPPVSKEAREIQLFRIAQEAVHNATKHSQARNILIRLDADNSEFRLTVKDDGVGLHPGKRKSGGMGMHIMRHRVGLIGGKLEVCNGDDGGMVVSCKVPIPRKAKRSRVHE